MQMNELREKLGKLLELERRRQNIDLEQMAAELKTSEENLQAIERGDIDSLPSELYFNLFAKSYSEALGIDYPATVDAIKADIGQPLELDETETSNKSVPESETIGETTDAADAEPANGGSRQVKKLVYLLGGIVVIFIVFLVIYKIFFATGESTTAPEQAVQSVPLETVSSSDISPADSDDAAAYNWNVPAYEEPGDLVLTMQSRNQSWAAVTADGDTAIYRTLTPGRIYEVSAKYRMSVSVGVPSVVDIKLNGEPVDLRRPSGRIYQVDITQLNVDEILGRATASSQVSPTPPVRRQNAGEAEPVNVLPAATEQSADTAG